MYDQLVNKGDTLSVRESSLGFVFQRKMVENLKNQSSEARSFQNFN